MPTLVLTKVGNSVGLVIPEDLLLALNLEIGSKVDVTQVGGINGVRVHFRINGVRVHFRN